MKAAALPFGYGHGYGLDEIAHDLRSPLNAMLGWARLLRDGILEPRDRRRAIAAIERSARLQAQLLEQLSPSAASRRRQRSHRRGSEHALFDPAAALEGIRVLVADDDGESRAYFRQTLRQRGARVRAVPDPERALAAIRSFRPDVLLSNLQMPRGGGMELIRQVRTLEENGMRRLPAAVVTGASGSRVRREALAAGFQVFVAKPVDPLELVRVIARLGDSAVSAA